MDTGLANFKHGQHVIRYPEWTLHDADLAAQWGEEMIIDEVIDRDTIVVRPLNSDATFTARAEQLSSPFGDACRCREGDDWPCT